MLKHRARQQISRTGAHLGGVSAVAARPPYGDAVSEWIRIWPFGV